MKTIKLSNKEIQMRKPKVLDLRAIEHIKNETEQTFMLISNLTGISEGELDQMGVADFKKLSEGLQSFL